MSASKKTKLELTWIGKENRPRLEPRILIPDDSKSHHAKHRVSDGDLFDNRLIFGDNLLTNHKRIHSLESTRIEKHRFLFEAQDPVDRQRDELVADIEKKLTQNTTLQPLFGIRWGACVMRQRQIRVHFLTTASHSR